MFFSDFETVCVKEESYRETENKNLIGKHVPISVSVSSKLVQESIFLCNTYSHHLVSSFFTALEGLATQSKDHMKLKLFEVETAFTIKVCKILQQLKQRHNREETVTDFVDVCIVDSEEQNLSKQFLQRQRNQIFNSLEHFERYLKELLVFGFNSAEYDLN